MPFRMQRLYADHFGNAINSKNSVREHLEAAKEANPCFKSLTGKYRARNFKSNFKCGNDGCKRNHSRMLHNRQIVTHKIIQSPTKSSGANLANNTVLSVKSLFQVEPVRIYANERIFFLKQKNYLRQHFISNSDRQMFATLPAL